MPAYRTSCFDIDPSFETELMEHMFIGARQDDNAICSIKIHHADGTGPSSIEYLLIVRIDRLRQLDLSGLHPSTDTYKHNHTQYNKG